MLKWLFGKTNRRKKFTPGKDFMAMFRTTRKRKKRTSLRWF